MGSGISAPDSIYGRIVKMAWLTLLAAVGLALTAPALAIADSAQFNISAEPLPQALKAFAAQAHMQLLYEYGAVAHAKGNAVVGDLEKHAALEQLLRNSGLEAVYSSDTAATIRRVSTTLALPHSQTTDQSQDSQSRSRLQLAQATSGQTSSAAPVEGKTKAASPSELQEVIVTAQKRPERLQDVPISISVLAGADLDKSTVQGVSGALGQIPGVAVSETYDGGGTLLRIRGVTANGALFDGSSPIAYYLDSVPFGLVKSAILPDPNPYDLDRIEVLRGPQGTLYGANAEDGVVRVLTNDADLNNFDFKARTSGSDTQDGGGNYDGDVAVNVPIVDGKLAVRAVLGYQNLSGWIDNPDKQDINNAELRNYRLKINAQPTEGLSIGLSAWSSRDSYGAPSTSDNNGRIASTMNQPISTDYDAYGLKIGYNSDYFSLSSATSYLDYANSNTLDLTPLEIPLPLFTGLNAHVFSQEVIVTSAPSSAWIWTGGAFYRNATDFQLATIPAVIAEDLSNTSRSYAAFGQFGRRFFDNKLEWTLGLRYFHDDVSNVNNVTGSGEAESFSHTSPRAVLTWYPTSDFTIYGSYSQGFRSGALQDTGYVPAGFPNVKPDELNNYEIGAKADLLDKRISLDTAIYYVDWKDVQQSLAVPLANGVCCYTALVNGQSASGLGVDLGVTTRPVNGLELGVAFNWNDLTTDANVYSDNVLLFAKGDRLNFSPEYTAGAFTAYLFPLGASNFTGRFSISANYTSEQDDRTISNGAQVVQSGDPIFIGRASFSVEASRHWTATIYVDNFTNDRGAVLRQAQDVPVPDWASRLRPMTLGMQFDYSFR